MERFDHERARIRLEQRVPLLHQLNVAIIPRGIVLELVFHDQRHTPVDQLQHVRKQRHMLVVPFRRVGRRDDQRRILLAARQQRSLGVARLRGGVQRDARQLVVAQILDFARISSHSTQIGVVHNHDFAVARELNVKFDAVPGFTCGRERRQRVFRRDRPVEFLTTVPGFGGHATRQRHVFTTLLGVRGGQPGARVVQAAMRVPRVRHGRHIMLLLVFETARRDRPQRRTCERRTTDQHVPEDFRFRHMLLLP